MSCSNRQETYGQGRLCLISDCQSLTNWVERMRRTFLVLLISHKKKITEGRQKVPLPHRSGLCLFCCFFSATLIFDIDRENGRFYSYAKTFHLSIHLAMSNWFAKNLSTVFNELA